MPNETKDSALSPIAADQVRIMRALLDQGISEDFADDGPLPKLAADLKGWTHSTFNRAVLSAAAEVLLNHGIGDLRIPEVDHGAGSFLAGLVADGFWRGYWHAGEAFVLPNGSDVNVEQRERNAAVLRILNDPAHHQHGALVDFVAKILAAAERAS